ncbi:MAG: hypothetical protein ACFFG0_23845 [Candidatus Thorarchaeota archaeon]
MSKLPISKERAMQIEIGDKTKSLLFQIDDNGVQFYIINKGRFK